MPFPNFSRMRIPGARLLAALLVAAVAPVAPPALADIDGTIARILAGEAFEVVLDGPGCPGDEGWHKGNDPLGTLKCGETYQVRYQNGNWVVTGPNEAYGFGTWTYSNADPRKGRISLWGIVVSFQERIAVFDSGQKDVGTLRWTSHPAASAGAEPAVAVSGGKTAAGGSSADDTAPTPGNLDWLTGWWGRGWDRKGGGPGNCNDGYSGSIRVEDGQLVAGGDMDKYTHLTRLEILPDHTLHADDWQATGVVNSDRNVIVWYKDGQPRAEENIMLIWFRGCG